MKKIEISVVTNQSSKIEKSLHKFKVSYTVSTTRTADKEILVYSTLVPDNLLNKIMSEISDKIDLRIKENTVSVYPVEAYVSAHLDRLEEKVTKAAPQPNPLEDLVTSTNKYSRFNVNVMIMACFAALIALTGLFLDNVAIVIGAMLLSPLLGPINAFAVNANLGRLRKLALSQFSIMSLLALIFVLSAIATAIITIFFPLSTNTSQIMLRSHASLIDVAIALVLGFAGGLALLADLPETLVGVAVAVALLPPAAVTGIGLATTDTELFFGALVLTFVYLVGLQLGCTLILRVGGVIPRKYYQKKEAKLESAYSIIVLSILFIVLLLIVILLNK